MNTLLVLPILIPLFTAAALICLWRYQWWQRLISIAGMAALLGVAIGLLAGVMHHGVQAVQGGNWPAPYGITLVADLLAGIMVLLTAVTGMAVVVYSTISIDAARQSFGYHPLLHILLMGVCGAFLTGDMFNLYVCFEIMLMASFVLITLGSERGQMEGAIKYVTLNLISSSIFLAGAGILYGVTGTLNFADLGVKLQAFERPIVLNVLAMMFLVAFGIKAAIFPLFFWLPASYHTPPAAISAIFAGLLTKVGVYALIRVFTLVFVQDLAFTHGIILVLAAATMLTGVLGAAAQVDFRRILSFHIISQIGYMIMGLGLMAVLAWQGPEAHAAVRLAIAGSVFYITHHIIVKANLFLVSGVVERLQGTGRLERSGGFYTAWPLLSILFLIPALSLAGIPPLSGFWAKFVLVKAGLEAAQYWIVAVALVVGLLTLYSMTKIWAAVFWSPAPESSPLTQDTAEYRKNQQGIGWMIWPIAAMASITVIIGIFAGPIFDVALQSADQLLDPRVYIEAVGPVRHAVPDDLSNQLSETAP